MTNRKTRPRPTLRDLFLLSLIYVWPIFLSIGLCAALFWTRGHQAVPAIVRYATQGAAAQTDSSKGQRVDLVTERMERFLANPRRHPAIDEKQIKKSVRDELVVSLSAIVMLSLLPFGFLWSGFRLRWGRLRDTENPITPKEALDGWWMRAVISACVAISWIYLFSPFGQGASAVYVYLKHEDMISTNTLPVLLDLTHSEIRHMLMGVLGWYIHLLVVLVFRAELGDVMGAKLYRLIFQKFLIVLGAAATLASVAPDASLVAAFILGIFPMNAISILRELGQKKFDTDNTEADSLSLLPNVSRSAISRLQEEGIDSMPALALADLDTLDRAIPDEVLPRRQLEVWIDTARLIGAVGPDKWKDLRWLCQTASEFKRALHDPNLHTKLQEQVGDGRELAARLEYLYPSAPTLGGSAPQGALAAEHA